MTITNQIAQVEGSHLPEAPYITPTGYFAHTKEMFKSVNILLNILFLINKNKIHPSSTEPSQRTRSA